MENQEQIEYWNGEAGQRWADSDAMMERLLAPISEALLAHTDLAQCSSALDIGCGGGSQSEQLARLLGEGGQVTGIDISAPLLAIARAKADQPESGRAELQFLQADASSYTFETENFDLLFSRFGVMFFEDPQAAFANIATGLRPGAKLVFACWRSLMENDWAWAPLQTALQHLPPPPAPEPNAPGPFAFADPERLKGILSGAGFSNIELTAHATSMQFGEYSTLAEAATNLARLGPLSRLLDAQPQDVKQAVIDGLVENLSSYYSDGALRLPGSVWFVTANTPE